MKTKDNIDELLAKHFAGEKMPDEQTEILNRWIELNYDEYRKIKQLMDDKIDNNLDCFDTEKAWSKIEKQLEDKTDIRRHNYKKISTFASPVSMMKRRPSFLTLKNAEPTNFTFLSFPSL